MLLTLPGPWLLHLENEDNNSFQFMEFGNLELTEIVSAKDFV
jgi:hypothetical protein